MWANSVFTGLPISSILCLGFFHFVSLLLPLTISNPHAPTLEQWTLTDVALMWDPNRRFPNKGP